MADRQPSARSLPRALVRDLLSRGVLTTPLFNGNGSGATFDPGVKKELKRLRSDSDPLVAARARCSEEWAEVASSSTLIEAITEAFDLVGLVMLPSRGAANDPQLTAFCSQREYVHALVAWMEHRMVKGHLQTGDAPVVLAGLGAAAIVMAVDGPNNLSPEQLNVLIRTLTRANNTVDAILAPAIERVGDLLKSKIASSLAQSGK